MELKINQQEFNIFLDVSKKINVKFGIIPILYGSLGLNKDIGEFCAVNDVDVLVPSELINNRWEKLVRLMKELDFTIINEREHEFQRNKIKVAFAQEEDLSKFSQINLDNLKISTINQIKFRELSPEQYLKVYQRMLRDNYRQDKRGNADKEKIALIKKYLKIED